MRGVKPAAWSKRAGENMGGTTITVYGATETEVLDKLKEQVKGGFELGLYPDSEAVIINGDDLKTTLDDAVLGSQSVEMSKARLFNVKLDEKEMTVDFEEVEKGRIFHVGIAARFSRPPKEGELLGTLHLHT